MLSKRPKRGTVVMTAINFTNASIPVTETVTSSVFTGNQAVGELPGSGGLLRGVRSGANPEHSLSLEVRSGANHALAGSSASFGGITGGGAVHVLRHFKQRRTRSSTTRRSAARARGVLRLPTASAIQMFSATTLSQSRRSRIASSRAVQVVAGSGGGSFAFTGGGAFADIGSTTVVSNTAFLENQAIGSRGSSGVAGTEADGGEVWASGANVTIQGGVIVGNQAIGGNGGDAPGSTGGAGGTGGGGGIEVDSDGTVTVSGTTIAGNSAIGGSGGSGSTPGTSGNRTGGGIRSIPLPH